MSELLDVFLLLAVVAFVGWLVVYVWNEFGGGDWK